MLQHSTQARTTLRLGASRRSQLRAPGRSGKNAAYRIAEQPCLLDMSSSWEWGAGTDQGHRSVPLTYPIAEG